MAINYDLTQHASFFYRCCDSIKKQVPLTSSPARVTLFFMTFVHRRTSCNLMI